jgi:hypothetical protein
MATLGDVAKLVRSKNVSPFWLTIDIMFDDVEACRRGRWPPMVPMPALRISTRPSLPHAGCCLS